ncbi:hypothetical protein AVEN_108118-1 [Araneus ventricosus]|uniref:Uncharacterized protein n=1 Tax=Araneus ventricosus TaxID=182803 RepID=A0A4Y2H246_ARAVE|nr:hypothetical protein AVEN_108118-1 [Araneus ventricosus]
MMNWVTQDVKYIEERIYHIAGVEGLTGQQAITPLMSVRKIYKKRLSKSASPLIAKFYSSLYLQCKVRLIQYYKRNYFASSRPNQNSNRLVKKKKSEIPINQASVSILKNLVIFLLWVS